MVKQVYAFRIRLCDFVSRNVLKKLLTSFNPSILCQTESIQEGFSGRKIFWPYRSWFSILLKTQKIYGILSHSRRVAFQIASAISPMKS